MIDSIVAKAKENGLNLYSVAVMDENGVTERIINEADQCTNSYSVAKAFTMTAIGMLYDAHEIDVRTRVFDILRDEFPEKFDCGWKNVTVEHLLTHKAGFGRGLLDIDVDDLSDYATDDFLRIVLSEPLPYAPGTRFVYTDAAFYLLSRIVTKLSGERLDDFLRPTLFGTLRFRETAWSVCPRGYCIGATGLYLRTSDMVKLGFVYANEGCYGGKQIVSPEWVKLVLERGYEFTRQNVSGVYAKGGMYGQMLCFLPEKRLACAWHGHEREKDTSVLFKAL